MVPHQADPPPFSPGGPVDHVGHGAVMADEIQVHGGEMVHRMAQVPGQGQGFEKHFRQDDGGTRIDEYPVFQPGDVCGKGMKIMHGCLSTGSCIKLRMHVQDIGSQGHMHGDREVEPGPGGQKTQVLIRQVLIQNELSYGPTQAYLVPALPGQWPG